MFRHDLYNEGTLTSPVVIFNNQDVLMNGFGQNVQLHDFDVVKNLQSSGANVTDGIYSLSDLQQLGLSSEGTFGDHAFGTNLYFHQSDIGVSSLLGAGTAAYVFGSVRFQLSADTQFYFVDGQLVSVSGNIELQNENFDHETTTLSQWVSAIVAISAGDIQVFDEVIIQYEGEGAERKIIGHIEKEDWCFVATTAILMFDDSEKPIEHIQPGDMVKSYDRDGNLVAGRVKQTFVKEVEHVLDFFGTGVTPGHVYLCSAGKFKGQHAPLIDILRDDGGVVAADGTLIRAATGTPIGSENDVKMVWAVRGTKTSCGGFQVSESKKIRLSTRVITEAGNDLSVADILKGVDASVNENAMIQIDQNSGVEMPFHWTFSESLPEPEDYVLRRSGLTLEVIYEAAEWEGMPTVSSMAIQ